MFWIFLTQTFLKLWALESRKLLYHLPLELAPKNMFYRDKLCQGKIVRSA